MTRIVSPLVNYFLTSGFAKDYTGIPSGYVKSIVTKIDNITPSGRIYFQSDSELDNSTIQAIEVITTSSLVAQPKFRASSGDFFPNLSNAQAANINFCLAMGDEVIMKVPLTSLVRFLNAGKIAFLNSKRHIWQDCFLEIEDNAGIILNQCAMLTVYYDKNNEN